MRIVLLGPPGSGKGTQGRFLAKKFHTPLLGMGDLLRSEVSAQTKVGKEIAPILAAGGFPPRPLVNDLLFSKLGSSQAFIVDGYPRDLEQADALDRFLTEKKQPLTHAIFFRVEEAFLLKRLLGRYTCETCGAPYAHGINEPSASGRCDFCGSERFASRPDDQESVARMRIQTSRERDAVILDYYGKKGILHEVNGMLSVPEVANYLLSLLGNGEE